MLKKKKTGDLLCLHSPQYILMPVLSGPLMSIWYAAKREKENVSKIFLEKGEESIVLTLSQTSLSF